VRLADVLRHLGGAGAAPLARFLERQRWFAAKARGARSVRVQDGTAISQDPLILLLLLDADEDRYYVPLSVRSTAALPVPAEREVDRLDGRAIVDAHWDPDFGRQLLLAVAAGRRLEAPAGRFMCHALSPWHGPPVVEIPALAVRPLSAEQSNTSIRLGPALIAKSFRRPQAGVNPDFEMLHFLSPRFEHVPRLVGWIEYAVGAAEPATIALVQSFVENTGDGWSHALSHLRALADALPAAAPPREPRDAERRLPEAAADFIGQMRQLGSITGGLHAALAADPSAAAFTPEPVTAEDVARWSRGLEEDLARLRADLRRQHMSLPETVRSAVAPLLDEQRSVAGAAADLSRLVQGRTHKIRCHGDYHLGQVLRTADGFVVIDFEGEPARPVGERRAKHSPLRDVAGMLRSFNYAVHAAAMERPAADRDALGAWLEAWERLVRAAFREGYLDAARKSPVGLVPTTEEGFARAGAAFELEKALYELRYELNHRPDWIPIPAAGISRILRAARS
jgi:maltose alpha-D-glucosyltransferase/alpha-amylase